MAEPEIEGSQAEIGRDRSACDAFRDITDIAVSLLGVSAALVCIEEPWLTCRPLALDRELLPVPGAPGPAPLARAFCARMRLGKLPPVIEDARQDPLLRDDPAVSGQAVVACLGIPITDPEGVVIGALCLLDGRPRAWTDGHVAEARCLALAVTERILLHAALEASRHQLSALRHEVATRRAAEAELARLASTDPLTGALNRRALAERAEAEILRCRRYGHELGIVLLDLDHFKRINDGFGHATGDAVLQQVCARIEQAMRRRVDVLARIGGEEFCLLLPESGAAASARAAERIRREIAACPVTAPDGREVRVTASAGVATWHAADAGFAPALARADRALYLAKKTGRNRVERAGGPPRDSSVISLGLGEAQVNRRDSSDSPA